jgi:hypothetical protein
MNRDSGPPTQVFIIGAFIGILKSPPPADVMQEDGGEIDLPAFDVPNHLLQSFAVPDAHTTLADVRILFDDLHSMAFGILPDDVHLVAGQVLVRCGRSHVSGDMVGRQVRFIGFHKE